MWSDAPFFCFFVVRLFRFTSAKVLCFGLRELITFFLWYFVFCSQFLSRNEQIHVFFFPPLLQWMPTFYMMKKIQSGKWWNGPTALCWVYISPFSWSVSHQLCVKTWIIICPFPLSSYFSFPEFITGSVRILYSNS